MYTVSLTASNAGGSDTETKTDYIDVVDVLIVIASADPENICLGDSTQLSAIPSGGEGNYTFSWTSSPPGFTSDEQLPIVSPLVNTTYTVVATDSMQTDTDQVTVQVNPLPVIVLGDWPDDLCNENEPPIQLTAQPEGGTYTGDAVTEAGLFSPEEAPLGWNVITYTFEDTEGCQNSAQDSIFVDECVGITDFKSDQAGLVIFPNPSSGIFEVESNGDIQSIEMLTQSGSLVYTSTPGESNVRIQLNLKPGIYYIKARVNFRDEELTILKKMLIQ
jgi:PKD repeat protein